MRSERPDEEIRSKSRQLKKYEADTGIFVRDGESDEDAMDFFSPFGPILSRTRMSSEVIDRLNSFADGIVSPTEGMEFIVPEEQLHEGGHESFAHQASRSIARYLGYVDKVQMNEVRFDVVWMVSQYASTPSPVHFHSGDISGVLYLKVPQIHNEAQEELRTYISGRQAGYINFISGGKQQYSKSLISFKPAVGDFYVFPGWLLHGAEPFRGEGERRSLAFNAFVR
ncbi:MAG: hypothetical protein H6822_18245 [Planctomycetaceae bacterium]|nr:hypothetical protein [Planctomycetales bacterium]MCB9924127.1 hypothetical protein [Planctomycetaceae bacterium]